MRKFMYAYKFIKQKDNTFERYDEFLTVQKVENYNMSPNFNDICYEIRTVSYPVYITAIVYMYEYGYEFSFKDRSQ